MCAGGDRPLVAQVLDFRSETVCAKGDCGMAERASSFVNVAMWHGGRYSTATKGSKDVIDGATPLVLDAIRRIPDTDAAKPFTLTDMGCADGGTSIDVVRQATAAVRARWSRRSIWGVYADQPRNDYNRL